MPAITPLVDDWIQRGRRDPQGFWEDAARELPWFRGWDRVFESTFPSFRWFVGAQTNLAYNALDGQVARGRGPHPALVYFNERGERRSFTYAELLREVTRVSAALSAFGIRKGDRLTIYMPTCPEAIVLMLATVRIGAIHSVVFAGFGARALADRIAASGSRLVFTASVTYRKGKDVELKSIVDEAIRFIGGAVEQVIVLERPAGTAALQAPRDVTWDDFVSRGAGHSGEHAVMEANEPAFILATSGTTAKPKLAVHTHGGYQVHIVSMGRWCFGMTPDDVWWATSDVGWIVGHSYMVYAPLLIGCTTIAFEGALDHPPSPAGSDATRPASPGGFDATRLPRAPDGSGATRPGASGGVGTTSPRPDANWRAAVEEFGATGIFTSPTAVRMLMRYGDRTLGDVDHRRLRRVVCAGEVLNPQAWDWLQNTVLGGRAPVIDHMWQTETGGPAFGNPYGIELLPIKPGSSGPPLPGIEAAVVTLDGTPCAPGEKGIMTLTRPFPGMTPALWGEPGRYAADYWERIPGLYYSGDSAHVDEDGYFWFAGRADEIIKIAAHRLGTIEVESAFLTHPAVAECGVIGRPDETRGEVIAAFVLLKHGHTASDDLRAALLQAVRRELGAVAVIGDLHFVGMLPKTRSGKIMRRVLKAVVLGRDPGDITTIEDEGSVDEARQAWRDLQGHMS